MKHGPRVEFNKIIDNIYLGTNLCCGSKSHNKILLDQGINADIDLEMERQEQTPGIDLYLWLPVEDHQAPTKSQLDVGTEAIAALIKNNKKVYIHCKNGHGRSPTLVAAYFISQGMTVEQAIEKIRAQRPEIHLEEIQLRALKEYRKSLIE